VPLDNVEVLANSVSARSHNLTAFNTISRAIETSGKGGPVTTADVEAQSSWLISAGDSLVKVRPEYGKLSTPARQPQRKNTIATSAVVIYGLVGAMSTMYADQVDPDIAFTAIAPKDKDDFFAWSNPCVGHCGHRHAQWIRRRHAHYPQQLPCASRGHSGALRGDGCEALPLLAAQSGSTSR
jgi:hypothetical protein